MPLSGTFSTMPPSDLFQWLADSRKTGTLTVALDFEERFLRFAGGCVAGVEGDDPRAPDLGRVLLEHRAIDEEQLAMASSHVEATGTSLARVLLAEGRISTAALERALTEQARRTVLSIFLWREAQFHFHDGGPSLLGLTFENTLLLGEPLPIRPLILEGIQRLDEWQRIVEVFPNDYCQVHALGSDPSLPALMELRARGEPVSLGELWARGGGDRYRIYEELFRAWGRGLLAVDTQAPATPGGGGSPVDTLVDNGRVLLEERQFDEAVALLRGAIHLDPGRDDVRELMQRASQEQLAELYQIVPPYKVPHLRISREELEALPLTPRERHLAERINGRWDVGSLVVVTPVGELQAMRTLKKLIHTGVIRLA